jgi:ABC-type Fe3+/spermidine/putrescine transport system ATPase subunit
MLERLGIAPLAERRPAEMSGGEQQRVGLGRALARRASVYLFDEPTAHLDSDLRERLQAEISEHRRDSGAAAIYATHDTAEALAIADRVLLLRAGRIVQGGTPVAVYERPIDLWAARLTGPASIVRLEIVDVRAGTASIVIDGVAQTVRVASGVEPTSGRSEAIVRPEWARLGGPLSGRVEVIAFRGTHTDYELSTSLGWVGIRAAGPPAAGRGGLVSWTLERAWLLPAPGESAR